MKKLSILMIALIVGSILTLPHIHDENCGYNKDTGEGCIYETANPDHTGRFGD